VGVEMVLRFFRFLPVTRAYRNWEGPLCFPFGVTNHTNGDTIHKQRCFDSAIAAFPCVHTAKLTLTDVVAPSVNSPKEPGDSPQAVTSL